MYPKKFSALCFLFLVFFFSRNLFAQSRLLPLSQDINNKIGRSIYFLGGERAHTALQPYIISDVIDSAKFDTLISPYKLKNWQTKNWFYRKVFSEHLLTLNSLSFDFLPDVQIGKQGATRTWLNTRGFQLNGQVGEKFSFTTCFYENQGRFPLYYRNYVTNNRVVPGQGYARTYGEGGLDYAYSGGVLSYTPSRFINLQLGYDKNFIGDGYRSMLLSDNAFNYPFFKVTALLGPIQYMAMWAQLIDFQGAAFDDDTPFPKKYGVFHYLDWRVNRRLSLGLFENVMMRPRGFEFGYVNPIIFLRPIEFANGSPDKVLIGATASYKIADRYVVYGQLMINEFTAKEVFANRGYWANKQGGQLGIKGFDLFQIPSLNLQLEANVARPYSYSADSHFKNYGHYGEPIAHPFGANFREILAIANYQYRRFNFKAQGNHAVYGLDVDDNNYGKNIYKNYTTRVKNYGVYIGQGLTTHFTYINTSLSYLLNPKTNLRIETSYTLRNERNRLANNFQQFVALGIYSSFRNLYQDF